MPVLQSRHGLSLEVEADQDLLRGTNSPLNERMVRDRLRWMRFCGPGSRHGAGCAHAVRMSRTGKQRGALIRADAPDALLQEPDSAINQAGVISRAGQNEPL